VVNILIYNLLDLPDASKADNDRIFSCLPCHFPGQEETCSLNQRNLLVIPAEEVPGVPAYSGKDVPSTYGHWNGAYVFGVTPEQGFVLKGRVAHESGAERFSGSDRVIRSLSMDDILSTISSRSVIMSRLDDPGTAITTITLPSPVYRWLYPVME
jgi:hypothetical protein